MQLSYDARADRLLWKLRTRAGDIYAVWLTRRLALRLWAPFQNLVGQASVQTVAAQPTLTPAAREMLVDAARQRPLPSADFKSPFDPQPVSQPLGPEPLLPDLIDLVPVAQPKGIHIKIRETGGRGLEMHLTADLATALLRLVEQALGASEWLSVPAAPTPVPGSIATGTPPTTLN